LDAASKASDQSFIFNALPGSWTLPLEPIALYFLIPLIGAFQFEIIKAEDIYNHWFKERHVIR
jgi:hypothetical protein